MTGKNHIGGGGSNNNNNSASTNSSHIATPDAMGTFMKTVSIQYIDHIHYCSPTSSSSQNGSTDYPMSERFMKYVASTKSIENNNTPDVGSSSQSATTTAQQSPPPPSTPLDYPASQCVSIVYMDRTTESHDGNSNNSSSNNNLLERLDIIIPNSTEYDQFITTLNDLIVLSQKELQQYTYQMQLLQYHYRTALSKDWYNDKDNKLSLQEWMTLCDKLQVPVKKPVLQLLFKEQCHRYRATDKLNISTIVSLLDAVRDIASDETDPIGLLWKELVRTDPVPMLGFDEETTATTTYGNNDGTNEHDNNETSYEVGILREQTNHSISSVALLSFIRSQQKNYTASLEQVTEMVRYFDTLLSGETILTNQPTSENNIQQPNHTMMMDRLTKGRFMSWLLSDENDIVDPEYGRQGSDDMTHPISHYYVSTSHDTYLTSIPEMITDKGSSIRWKNDFVSVHQYMNALLRGVRCIEIDVWDDTVTKSPVVAFQQNKSSDTNNNSNKASSSSSSSLNAYNSSNIIPLVDVFMMIRYFLLHIDPNSYPIILRIENHCSTRYQLKLANMIYEIFSVSEVLCRPPEFSHHTSASPSSPNRSNLMIDARNLHQQQQQQTLPSPEDARGKVIILGKRPKRIKVGACTFINDDLDSDGWQMLDPTILSRYAAYENDEFNTDDFYSIHHDSTDPSFTDRPNNSGTIVVGFDINGPIRKKVDNKTLRRSPTELYRQAKLDSERAMLEKDAAMNLQTELTNKADTHEVLAASLTQQAGMSPEEVKHRASRAARRGDERAVSLNDDRNSNDEGLEIHEILPDLVEDNQDAYAEAVQKSMEVGQMVNIRRAELLAAEQAQQRAESDLQMSRQLEQIGIENAKKAAAEARVHQEHADVAIARIETVREMFKNSADSASSAGTVVQTAQTEATISKKRAADAEGRAARAQMTAEKDRERADEETRKEELLEQEVSDLHITCQEATEASQAARVKLDKASAMFDRVTEQIKLIEKSTQYRKELAASNTDISNVRHGGSFLAKHEIKLEERNTCRELMKEASEERSAAEARFIALRSKFEEKARTWKVQANVALQARRTADRSAHVAEELAEHAEEEREAAQLRQFAREKAIEAVENRSSLRQSVEAQLAEAERAATEAAEIAAQSRNRAQRLQQEVDKVGNHATFINLLEQRKQAVDAAKNDLALALNEKQEYDKLAEEEKRRLDTNSSVYRSAAREAVTEGNRAKVVHVLQQEAIVAYNTALMLRKQADTAIQKTNDATTAADNKKKAAEHAREYKARMDMLIEMPVLLAKSTLLHSSKFMSWERSHGLTGTVSHSLSQNILLEMIEKDTNQDIGHIQVFTRDHLCRVFSSWRITAGQSFANCDPVFAWSMGCQMVGMNYQSADENLLVADGRFRQNGSCGYVLKPRCLIDTKEIVEQQQSLTFQVLGAYNLPKIGRKIITPRVRVSLYCGSTTETRKMFKTKFARANGINPSWDETDSVFNFMVPKPSVAMISFSIWDRCGDKAETFVAGAAFPVTCIRDGYRSIALFSIDNSRNGAMKYASLLVKVSRR